MTRSARADAKRAYVSVRNFRKYQHYKDRRPPWVKLYVDLLTDEDLGELDLPARYLAMAILLVAANKDNRIPADPAWVAAETGLSRVQASGALGQLLAINYLVPASNGASAKPSDDASSNASEPADETASPRAHPRTRGEAEAETEPPSPPTAPSNAAAPDTTNETTVAYPSLRSI